MELSATRIRQEKGIEGIKIGNRRHKISLLAGDTTLAKNEVDLEKTWKIMDQFTETTGLKINKRKTQLLGLDKFRNRKTNVQGIRI